MWITVQDQEDQSDIKPSSALSCEEKKKIAFGGSFIDFGGHLYHARGDRGGGESLSG